MVWGGFLVLVAVLFFLILGVLTISFNFRAAFCYLVLALIGKLVWGAWHLLSDVFVSFQSRSKLFSGDVLEVSQVLHFGQLGELVSTDNVVEKM